MTALSSAGTMTTARTPGSVVIQAHQANVITRRDTKPIPDDGYYLTTSCVMGTFSPSVEPLIARTYDLLGRRWAMGGTGSASLTGKSRLPFSKSRSMPSTWGRFLPGPSSAATSKRASKA